jgi:hypothetical protein
MKRPGIVVISGAAGAWGDSSLSTPQLLADGRSDYVIYEGLAEITMAILTRAKQKDPAQGYARDLIETIAANIAHYRAGGVRVVTNAGGVNPHAAAALIKEADPSTSVGVVYGDDVLGNERVMSDAGLSNTPLSANAYLGARPIAAALDAGAEVVVTGRVVDSALALGPLIHEFQWARDQYDLLAAGSLAGHLIECGPQATGGLLTDWQATRSWSNPGFPIVEVSTDGGFTLTTPAGTDGLVDVLTVSEQLLYEIGDPAAYQLPDVVCDWTQVTLVESGPNRVEVVGARGAPPPSHYKACAQIADGWRTQFLLLVGGRDAPAKARRAGDDLVERGRRMLADAGMGDFTATDVEVLGAETTYGANARAQTREVVLKIAVHHESAEAISRFVREVPSIALAGPPGVTGGGIGLPRPTPLIRLRCFPADRSQVAAAVEVDGREVSFDDVDPGETVAVTGSVAASSTIDVEAGPTVRVPLIAIAHGRSGDKGADVNVGVRARSPELWPVLLTELTAERVGAYLAHLGASSVARFELPGIHAVNFLLRDGLGEGGTASLRFDPQGKAVAQQLLDMEIDVPERLVP